MTNLAVQDDLLSHEPLPEWAGHAHVWLLTGLLSNSHYNIAVFATLEGAQAHRPGLQWEYTGTEWRAVRSENDRYFIQPWVVHGSGRSAE